MPRQLGLSPIMTIFGLFLAIVSFTGSTFLAISLGFVSVPSILLNTLGVLGLLGFLVAHSQCVHSLNKRTKYRVYKAAVQAGRQQRHDILNEIAVASSYIQLGQLDKAQCCLDVLAADLSDRYNYNSLPYLAWELVIKQKKRMAKAKRISFTLKLKAKAPEDPNEQRLLPKLVDHLVTNALEAALSSDKPWVEMEWTTICGHRLLFVRNNGDSIPKASIDRVFQPRITSKAGVGRGWGLVICGKIAQELGGQVKVRSTDQFTEFYLILPADHLLEKQPA